MSYCLVFLLFILTFNASAQERFIIPFAPLDAPLMVHDQTQLDSLTEGLLVSAKNVMFCEGNVLDGDAWISMFKFKENAWYKYNLPYFESNRQGVEFSGLSDDGQFAFVKIRSSNHARGLDTEEELLGIVDIQNESMVTVLSYESSHEWQYSEDSETDELSLDEFNVSSSANWIEGNQLFMIRQCLGNHPVEYSVCYESGGVYTMGNGFLRKVKFYDPTSERMLPIYYVGNVAVGMSRNEFEFIDPLYEWMEVSAEMNGNYGGDICFEVCKANELIMVVFMNGDFDVVTEIDAVSPEFSFGSISTQSNLKQILKLYPNSTCKIEGSDDWEVLYIPELKLSCVFKTTDANRVAEYRMNAEYNDMEFVRFKRKNVTPDFIRVSGN